MHYKKLVEEYAQAMQGVTNDTKQEPLSGTVVAAIKYDKGVIMAGDTRVTLGHQIFSEDMEKVFAINNNVLLGMAGAVAAMQPAIELFQMEVDYFERKRRKRVKLSFKGQAKVLAHLIAQLCGSLPDGLQAQPILADQHTIYFFDTVGSRIPLKHTVIGIGAPHSAPYVQLDWREGLTQAEALKKILTVLKLSQYNTSVGPGKVIYTIEEEVKKLSEINQKGEAQ
ncbi:hypothetical protein MYX07_04210 [Patescibacteria group bacterium AH-259-L07]|nr:hypothetical protein [Patescibacteria group bacterium AH-259-L07]